VSQSPGRVEPLPRAHPYLGHVHPANTYWYLSAAPELLGLAVRWQDRPDVAEREPCRPTDSFRVTLNNFLSTGGDGFAVFKEGTDALGGAQDIDALVAYFNAAEPTGGIAPPPLTRIVPFS